MISLLWLLFPFFTQAQSTGNSCILPWGSVLYDGESTTWWNINEATYTQSCDDAEGILTCDNGYIIGGQNIYTFASCTDYARSSCRTPSGKIIPHLAFTWFYSLNISTYTKTCSQSLANFQCIDGDFDSQNWYNIDDYPYETCRERRDTECMHPWDETFVSNGTQLVGYSSTTSTNTQTCNELTITLTCNNGDREGWNPNSTYENCEDLGFKDCIVDNVSYPHWWSGIFYSNLTSIYPKTCIDIASQFSCINGIFIGDFNQYPYESCLDGLPADCKVGDTVVPHSWTVVSYSQETALYPKTCDQLATTLSCNNGVIIGNRNVFKYLWCTNTGWLVDGLDLRLEMSFLSNISSVAQYSSPWIIMTIKNRWTNLLNITNVPAGFLTCEWEMDNWQKLVIYQSNLLEQLTINPGTFLRKTIILKDIFTQSLGDKNIVCTLDDQPGETDTTNNIWSGTLSVIKAERFDIAMDRSIDAIRNNLDAPEILKDNSATPWADAIKDFILNKVLNILVPLIITLGILISILGFYKILFSSDDKSVEEGTKYLTYWVIWIIVIMSAKYIATTIYSDIFSQWILGYWAVQWYEIAQKIYEKIAFPFIKLATYLALWALFVILASRALTFIFGSDDDTKKKAWTIIAWNIVGMLVIIWAKQVIEFVYGKQQDVVKAVSNLGEIGSGILANKNLPILYEIINWAMWLSALVILVMVLVQAFQLLLKPDSPDAMKKIKNSLLYIFIWIIIIGTGYIITNFLIIN